MFTSFLKLTGMNESCYHISMNKINSIGNVHLSTRSVGVNRYVDLVIYVWLEVANYRLPVGLRDFPAIFRCRAQFLFCCSIEI